MVIKICLQSGSPIVEYAPAKGRPFDTARAFFIHEPRFGSGSGAVRLLSAP